MLTLSPASSGEVAEAVAGAAAKRLPLAITGLATKAALGRPAGDRYRLDLSGLSGISFYEPEELVLSALAGTPLEQIEALLAGRGQELAFEPMSFAALYGTGWGTIGGAVMAGSSGPRRIKSGGARDFVLGIKAVSGRGEAFKAGGRVVKNVTGYDLARGLTGSFGTLAVATEITLKVLPRAETEATLILLGLDAGAGVEALCAAMCAPAEVSGAAHLPALAASVQGFPDSITALRIEGFEPSVASRLSLLEGILKGKASMARLNQSKSKELWRAIRDVSPLAAPREKIIWKISVAPTEGPKVAGAVGRALGSEVLFDWSGGLVWLALDSCRDAAASLIRKAVMASGGGHATLVRAPDEIREKIPVFEPQAPALEAVSRRLKESFDPHGILEPRRMRAEF